MELKPPLRQNRGDGARRIPPQTGVRPFCLIPISTALGTYESRKGAFHPASPKYTNRKSFLQSLPHSSCCRTGPGLGMGKVMLCFQVQHLLTEKGLGVWQPRVSDPSL